jgi:hypothetical protein
MNFRRRGLVALAGTIGMVVATLAATTTTASAAPHFLESSHLQSCGKVDITLRNVSPWIYPMSVEIDGVHSYGPTVDNRTDMNGDGDVNDIIDLSGPQKDQTRTRTITFPEDTGTHTVRYRVQAGTEDDLFKNLPVGTWTELTIETDCANAAPTASIASPVNGATYYVGQSVTADYSCADTDSTVVSCDGPVADGAAVDTSTPGAKTFTVNATDSDGGTGSASVSYAVAPIAGECSAKAVNLSNKALDLGSTTRDPGPCVTTTARVLKSTIVLGATLPFPLNKLNNTLSVTLVEGVAENAGTTHRASAKVEAVSLDFPLMGWSFSLKNLASNASATLTGCGSAPVLDGSAQVGQMVVNNRSYDRLTTPKVITIPLVGTISANTVVKDGNKVRATALDVDLLNKQGDFSFGESIASISC